MEILEWEYDTDAKLSCDVITSDRCTRPRVLVVIVHGGAWMLGSKETFRGMARHISHELGGVTCVVPDYSLSHIDTSLLFQSKLVMSFIGFQILLLILCRHKRSRSPIIVLLFVLFLFVVLAVLVEHFVCHSSQRSNVHPRHVCDIAKCITATTANFFLGNEPVQIVLVGHSAGAHLCALLALNPEYLPPPIFNNIVATVAISGIYSLWEMQRSSTRHLLNKHIFVGMFDEDWTQEKLGALQQNDPERWRYITSAWPLFHITNEARKTAFLILTSDTDGFLLRHSIAFAQKLQEFGFENKHIHFKNTTHFSIHKHWNAKHNHIFQTVQNFILNHISN